MMNVVPAENFEVSAVVSHQTRLGGYPYITIFIKGYGLYTILWKSVVISKIIDIEILYRLGIQSSGSNNYIE
jgi:hypothetical protein